MLVITTFPQGIVGWEPPCLPVPGEWQCYPDAPLYAHGNPAAGNICQAPTPSVRATCWALGKRNHARCLGLRAVTLVRGDEDGDLMPSRARQEAMC